MIWKVSRRSGKFPDDLKSVQIIQKKVAGLSKILQNHLLCAFVANLKIGAIYALYPESFCDKNLAIRKVFAFCDSEVQRLTFRFRNFSVSKLFDFFNGIGIIPDISHFFSTTAF